MDFKTEKNGDVMVVELLSEALDAGNSKGFKKTIAPVLEENKNIVFDLTKVEFIDSSGCGALLSCLRKLQNFKGDLRLCGVSTEVRTLFELVRMHRIVEIFDTAQEAVNAFG
ncbi:STAS domain-containing protein [Desulfobacterales bacterium HSG17]|nr:STAS domain-containing protein [Desulfobacterales bacterium HSG17]